MRGNTQTSKQKREELARAAGRGAKTGGSESLNGWDVQSKRIFDEDGIAPTLNSGEREGGGIQPSVMQSAGFCGYASHTAKSIGYEYETAPTLKGNDWQCQVPDVLQATAIRVAQTNANGCGISEELAHTIDTTQPEAVAFAQNTRDEVRLQGGDGQVTWPIAASDSAKGQGVPFICMADDTQNAAIDENLSGTLKVGGGYTSSGVLTSSGEDVIGALCAADGTKGVGSQYVSQGKVICQRVT